MFSGLITHQGRIRTLKGKVLDVAIPKLSASLGDSIAINGVCLTVVKANKASKSLLFELSRETLQKTTLGRLPAGAAVNVEPALSASAKLGGHIVQGHVDGTGTVTKIERDKTVWFKAPPEILKYLVPKGSVTIDGISLTVAALKKNLFSVALIPYTIAHTTFKHLTVGTRVNMEADILGKYAYKYAKRK
jgi:riboflavin synthase